MNDLELTAFMERRIIIERNRADTNIRLNNLYAAWLKSQNLYPSPGSYHDFLEALST